MQPKTPCRVIYNGRRAYTGDYGNMPYAITHLDFDSCIVTANLEWKFYISY
uniref:Uncharacterized protein n=1 Tax=Podoviridae sp. ctoyw14 TaxID=2826578 RepID=A0A8S5LVX7_9CAUD|nr:MAG TPA: hypothetical protein [Podoviridae sp. ctoyw14]